jgi:hypothetical protein
MENENNIENSLLFILKNVVERIKNELLLAAVAAFAFIVIFPNCSFWISIIYLIGSLAYVLIKILDKGEVNNYLEKFNILMKDNSWRREIIDDKEVYFSDKDNSYQIEIGPIKRSFTEDYTRVYPDKGGSWLKPVYLKFQGVIIKEISFISCDGGRIFIPLPEISIKDGKRVFQYRESFLEYKIAKIIGDFYIHETIEKICKISNIEIIK